MGARQDCDFIDEILHLEVGGGCPIFIAAALLVPDAWGRRRAVSGRGLTSLEAENRCVSEAQERHTAVFNDSVTLIEATIAELGDDAVAPSELLLISKHQNDNVDVWNTLVDVDHQLPTKSTTASSIQWVAGRSLLTGKTRYIPAAHCYLGYPTALAEGFPVPDSNGLASGDTLDGALERSLMEVIERDAVSIWWYGRVRRPAMSLDYDQIPCWTNFVTWVRACNRQFWILDLTHDLGIPVAAAVSCNVKGAEISLGFGAGRTREKAVFAAMGEMVQFEITKRLQARNLGSTPRGFLAWCQSARLTEHEFLYCDDTANANRARHSVVWETCVESLHEQGLTAHLLDISLPDRSIYVTRAIVPGLRPLWPRFAPGRLYDVAPVLGWHKSRLSEAELNPIAILY